MSQFRTTNILKGYFWICELSKNNDCVTWNVEGIEDELDPDGELCLIVKCASLGESAIQKERNIVEVETKDYTREIKKWAILNLSLDYNPMSLLDLNFSRQTIFRLISGSGPVHIIGEMVNDRLLDDGEEFTSMSKLNNTWLNKDQYSQDEAEDVEKDDEEEEEVTSEEEAQKTIKMHKGKKASVTQQSLKKKFKMDKRKHEEEIKEEGKTGFNKLGNAKKIK